MDQQTAKKNRLTLLALLLVFLVPFLGAYWLYLHPGSVDLGTTNNGEFVQPARLLDATGIDLPKDYLTSHKWTLVYLGGTQCDADCEMALLTMRQTRLALGEKFDLVQRLYLVDGKPTSRAPEAGLAVADVSRAPVLLKQFDEPASAAHYIYLVDPRGYLMMRYSLSDDPKGLLKDMRHLLGGGEG